MRYAKIKKNSEFSRMFRKGKKVYSAYLTAIFIPSKNGTSMGIAITKKHGKAVVRNRVKRLIRAAFYNNFSYLTVNCKIIIMSKVCEEYDYHNIEKSLLSCFKKIKEEV